MATLNCKSCNAEVPEGATECPKCGAGIGTVMFGKKKGLTRTMIGKVVELRESIPWASASQVVMVTDEAGKKKARPAGLLGVIAVLALIGGVGYFAFRKVPKIAELAPPQETAKNAESPKAEPPKPAESTKPVEPPKPTAVAKAQEKPAEKPAEKAVEKPAEKPAEKPKPAGNGTLVIKAVFKGKPVNGATVMVNGEPKGTTPATVALAPSKYTLVIQKSGFKREKRTDVAVASGKKQTLQVELKK